MTIKYQNRNISGENEYIITDIEDNPNGILTLTLKNQWNDDVKTKTIDLSKHKLRLVKLNSIDHLNLLKNGTLAQINNVFISNNYIESPFLTEDEMYIYRNSQLFLVSKETNDEGVYKEYMWVNDDFEIIGSTYIDLEPYFKKENVYNGLDYNKNDTIKALSAYQGKILKGYVDGKAPINHAVNADTYGLSSENVYGHSMASKTNPTEIDLSSNALGNETAKFARGDHKHKHPAGTQATGKPTENLTPKFGDKIKISQVSSNNTGHVSAITDRDITIPNTLANGVEAGLSSNDFTDAEKTKLRSVAQGATNVRVVNVAESNNMNAISSNAVKSELNKIHNVIDEQAELFNSDLNDYVLKTDIDVFVRPVDIIEVCNHTKLKDYADEDKTLENLLHIYDNDIEQALLEYINEVDKNHNCIIAFEDVGLFYYTPEREESEEEFSGTVTLIQIDVTSAIPVTTEDLDNTAGFLTVIDLADYLKDVDVIDNLVSDNTTKPLSAKQGKALSERIPTKVSDLTNDSGYINSSSATNEINNHNTSSSAHSSLFNNKVDKEEGKGLSEKNFTEAHEFAIDNMNDTINTRISNHNIDGSAHSSLFNNKASKNHSHDQYLQKSSLSYERGILSFEGAYTFIDQELTRSIDVFSDHAEVTETINDLHANQQIKVLNGDNIEIDFVKNGSQITFTIDADLTGDPKFIDGFTVIVSQYTLDKTVYSGAQDSSSKVISTNGGSWIEVS